MSRNTIRETQLIPEHSEVTVSFTVTCDKCGTTYNHWDYATNEISIALDPEECVQYYWRRDYCTECAKGIWEALCAVLGADPDDEGIHGMENDD